MLLNMVCALQLLLFFLNQNNIPDDARSGKGQYIICKTATLKVVVAMLTKMSSLLTAYVI